MSLRVAILSADVAGGHDAAAQTLREQLLELAPDAEVSVDNGLAAAGTVLHHFIRDGFKLQLRSGGGSFDVMLGLLAKRPLAGAVRGGTGRVGGGGVRALVERRGPDLVVSTYPVVTAILGHLRRRGELGAPVAATIVDVAPHPLWLHPDVDLHLVAAPADAGRVREACPAAEVRHARPLVAASYSDVPGPAEARARVGLPADGLWALVDHSAWNVPPAHELVDPLLSRSDASVVVGAAGFEDESDVRELRKRYATTSRVQIRADEEEQPLLYAACDFVVTTVASTTAFAAHAAGTPPVVFRALPGHGEASARAASDDGLVLWARSEEELGRFVPGEPPWPEAAAAAVASGRRALEARPAAEEVAALAERSTR